MQSKVNVFSLQLCLDHCVMSQTSPRKQINKWSARGRTKATLELRLDESQTTMCGHRADVGLTYGYSFVVIAVNSLLPTIVELFHRGWADVGPMTICIYTGVATKQSSCRCRPNHFA